MITITQNAKRQLPPKQRKSPKRHGEKRATVAQPGTKIANNGYSNTFPRGSEGRGTGWVEGVLEGGGVPRGGRTPCRGGTPGGLLSPQLRKH